MQAQKEMPPDMQCKDKFLVQGVVATPGIAAKDITQEMFTKESGNKVDEVKLRVLYVAPPQPPSPVPEESEEGSSPRASEGEAKSLTRYATLKRAPMESEDGSSEVASMISGLTEERNVAIQQNKSLRQELETLRREVGKQQAGNFSFIVVVFVALLDQLVEEDEAVALLLAMSNMEEDLPEDVAATQAPTGVDGPSDPMSENAQDNEDENALSIAWSDLE
ncbi:vesicle-associated protein 1-2-like protein [Carex littledalei]|uniref:Vesicle-associated protein 1-2-like protein n=1 Tax=Carex littledalei TaxID=544730 RepID=A0A833V5C9_9POAL|nr:vesicle-associated protein 1-2-like protein [Carex littledalei]